MDITINLADGVPIYRQIVNQIRYLVASGLLRPGEELPPIRTLALQLAVTPNTVVRAYGELEAAGVLRSPIGSGDASSSSGSTDCSRRGISSISRQRTSWRSFVSANWSCCGPRREKSAMNENVVDVCGVSRQFGAKVALNEVSFSAQEGLVYGLVAGKTTLLKHLLGLLRAKSGTVRVFGLNPVGTRWRC
jgi:DNA-binding transcriptional regulator YhcF (GntR family)